MSLSFESEAHILATNSDLSNAQWIVNLNIKKPENNIFYSKIDYSFWTDLIDWTQATWTEFRTIRTIQVGYLKRENLVYSIYTKKNQHMNLLKIIITPTYFAIRPKYLCQSEQVKTNISC